MYNFEILELIQDSIVECGCQGNDQNCTCCNGKKIDLTCLLGILTEQELSDKIKFEKSRVKNLRK